MQINNIKWRNFNSYGNKWNELDLSESTGSFVFIGGKNGAGKSTLSAVIKFALYGKVDNRKLKDIPNRLNKNCEVDISLKASGYDINIKRGLEPSYFDVKINGLDKFGEQAGKLNIQDNLENEIFGMPFYVFSNIISLSVNDFKSFIKMNPSDKREIIDKIIGLSIINKMYEALKIDIKEIIENDNSLIVQNNVLSSQLKKTVIQLENLSKKLIESATEKQSEINEKIESLNKLKIQFKKECESKKAIINELASRINSNKNLIQEIKFQLKSINSKIKLYDNAKCPECESDLHTSWHENKLTNYNSESTALKSNIDNLLEIINNETENKEEIENEFDSLRKKINKIDTNNAVLQDQLSNIEDISYIDKQTESLKSIIDSTEEQLVTVKSEKKVIDSKLQFYKIIEESLGDKGIKQLAMKTILPTINAYIYQLIKELNLDFKLIFTEDWSCIVTHLGQEVNPSTLSTGENKKLDMAVILAIIKLMKLKFPGLNILFLDEVISSLDSDSSHHILKILSKISKDLNLHIFVVNHDPLDTTQFDYRIDVQKVGGFSNIEITRSE